MKKSESTILPGLAIVLIALHGISARAGDQRAVQNTDSLTLQSLQKLDGYPFYTLKYHGEYHFEAYLKGTIGFPVLNPAQSGQGVRCTCFAAMGNKDTMLFGRNFDFRGSIPLLLFTHPRGGYASVSMTDLQFFGYSRDNLPGQHASTMPLLKTPWLPIDGMNEKGVTIALLAVESTEPPNDPGKRTINETAMIRLVLDHAASVDQALELIRRYNVNTTLYDPAPEHFLIADPSGKSVIVEFLENAMKVTPNREPWQVATNFNVYGKDIPHIADDRYRRASGELSANLGNVSAGKAMRILKAVSQGHTQWSAVYNMTAKTMTLSVGRDYSRVFHFTEDNNKGGRHGRVPD